MAKGRHQRSPRSNVDIENRVRGQPELESAEPSSPELQQIVSWLEQTRFQKALFGGVQESDVWKKIEELNALYEQLLAAERVRYETLLEERLRGSGPQPQRRAGDGDGAHD